ncbi:MAG: OB-fold nucleic acid binding domain-containing protein, partial [Gemmatimonadota bacterium]
MTDLVEIKDLHAHVGETVTLTGWVETTRNQGRIAFAEIRDGTGVVQCVFLKKQLEESVWEAHGTLTQESTVAVTGEVRADDRAPGGYELGVSGL